jgi:nicotinate-nucleotide pyrophosphorylase (carboxylating)
MLPPGTDELIERALEEDLGDGDHTSLSTIPAEARGAAHLLVKATGVLAGMEIARGCVPPGGQGPDHAAPC